MSTRRTARVTRSKSGQAGPAAPAVPRVSGPPTAAKASVTGKGKGKQPAGKQPATVTKALVSGSSMLPSLSGQPAAEAAVQAVRDDLEIDARRRALRSAASAAADAADRSVLTRHASAEAVRRGETPGVQPKRRVPSGVGEFEEQVAVSNPEAEQAAQDAVERWMKTFTPGAPTADAQGILNMEFLENQRQAIVDGTMFIPPPLSVEGLAREALMRDGSGSLAVQQEILKLVGKRRQELVESVAAKLLTLERCAASAYAFHASGIAGNIKSWLTELLIGGSLPEGLMTYLADFIQTGGTYDILMNPAGWLMGELGALVTQDAINTYIAIWLTNQLIGAQMFAQMAGDKELNVQINLTSEELLKRIQNQSFFEQISEISSHIYGLFQESAANLVAAVAVGFNAPEAMIQEITRAGEERIVAMSEMPQMIMAQAAEDAQAAAERAQDRRARAIETAQTYGDAAEAARLAVRAPVQAAGLSDLGLELLSQIGGATAQLLRSALVLTGMRQPQATDVIVRMNNNIADLLIGRYLGYIQQMGYDIAKPPSEREPVIRAPLRPRDSQKIVDQIAKEGPAAAAKIAGLIDRRVAEINPAVVEEPCERRRGLADMPYSGQVEDDEEEVETLPLYPESQESWHSADSGPAATGGKRKRKHHSTRSSTSSKSSKSSTRKHGKSKRVKKGGAKTRHVRLPHSAGRRTRKHSKRGRK